MSLLKPLNLLNTGSAEAIAFQADSKFPSELTAIFQKVFDFIKAYDAKNGVVDDGNKAATKHIAIQKLFEEKINAKLTSVVKKFTGITITRIVTSLPTSFQGAIDMCMVTLNNTSVVSSRVLDEMSSGYGPKILKNNRSLDEIFDISRSLDKSKGKVLREGNILVMINIPIGLFVISDIFTNNVEKCQLTASEIAASFLHEIGHVLNYVEYMSDMGYLGYYGNNALRDVVTTFEKNPKDTIMKAVKLSEQNAKLMGNAFAKSILEKSTSILKVIVDKIDTPISIPGEVNPDYNPNVYFHIGLVLVRTIFTVVMIWRSPVSSLLTMVLPFEEIHELVSAKATTSNEYETSRNKTSIERLADEYVSRYRMSKDHSNAIIKLDIMFREYKRLGLPILLYNKNLRDSRQLSIFLSTVSVMDRLFAYLLEVQGKGSPDMYERAEGRLKRNISNLTDVIKSPLINRKMRDLIVQDIDEMTVTLNQYKPSPKRVIFEKLIRFILNAPTLMFITPSKHIYGNGNVKNEYFELFEQIDAMLSNKAHYYSAKISSIINR